MKKKRNERSGFVYVLTNDWINPVEYLCENGEKKMVPPVKVGRATGLPGRLGNLNSALPEPFRNHLYLYCKNPVEVEGRMHKELSRYQIKKSEFYACPINMIMKLLKAMPDKVGLKKGSYKFGTEKLDDARSAVGLKRKLEKRGRRLPSEKRRAMRFSFAMLIEAGVKIGSELVFVPDGKKVSVADMKNKIEYMGKPYTTTDFCKRFMPLKKRSPTNVYQGPKYFTFKGELLTDLRAKLGR